MSISSPTIATSIAARPKQAELRGRDEVGEDQEEARRQRQRHVDDRAALRRMVLTIATLLVVVALSWRL